MNILDIYATYYHVIAREGRLSREFQTCPPTAEEILNLTDQIKCIVESATVLRACATLGGLTKDEIAYESVSAHTNLVSALVDRVLSYEYGPYFDKTEDGFTYREIMEVIRRHDLSENVTGDTPDNGTRDEEAKLSTEHLYLRTFAKQSPSREADFEKHIKQLQYNMEAKCGFTGKLLYAADKVAATLMALCYDSKGMSPGLDSCQPRLSDKELFEMKICEQKVPGRADTFYKDSEMWAIDYFEGRKLYQYDTTGLLSAIFIMYIITTNGKWYNWREESYGKG